MNELKLHALVTDRATNVEQSSHCSLQSAVVEANAILSVPWQAFQRSHSSKRLDQDAHNRILFTTTLPFSFKASPDADWMIFESAPLTVHPFSFAPEVWPLNGGVFSRERWPTWVFHQTGYGKIKTKRDADYNPLDKLVNTILIGFSKDDLLEVFPTNRAVLLSTRSTHASRLWYTVDLPLRRKKSASRRFRSNTTRAPS